MTGQRNAMLKAALGLSALLAVSPACAADEATGKVQGSWSGEYVCNQGRTGLTLTIGRSDEDGVRALFHFYAAPGNPGVPQGCFEMAGRYDPASGDLRLKGGRWLLRPPGYVAVDFTGNVDAAGDRFEGRVTGFNCTIFRLSRRPSPRPTPPECRPDLVASAAPHF
jgi:hypothetical protein